MKKTRTVTLIALIIATTLALFTAQASAITNNPKPDTTPYVGVVVLFSDTAKTQPIGYCSGFLISPTVMVTAGHSLVGAATASICFDPGPIAYTIQDGEIIYYGTSTIYNGAPVLYERYIPAFQGNKEFGTSDIGLILLDEPVVGVTEFPTLPSADLTETMKTKTDLKVIGYGMQYQLNPRNEPMNTWTGTISRNSATVELLTSNFAGSDKYLKLTANPSQGKGAIAFGDSGGPVIYTNTNGQDIAVALNAFVTSNNCNGVSYHTRIDTPDVLDWINQHLC